MCGNCIFSTFGGPFTALRGLQWLANIFYVFPCFFRIFSRFFSFLPPGSRKNTLCLLSTLHLRGVFFSNHHLYMYVVHDYQAQGWHPHYRNKSFLYFFFFFISQTPRFFNFTPCSPPFETHNFSYFRPLRPTFFPLKIDVFGKLIFFSIPGRPWGHSASPIFFGVWNCTLTSCSSFSLIPITLKPGMYKFLTSVLISM